jgi:hypothetical protein
MSLTPGQNAAKQEVVVVTRGAAPEAGAVAAPAAPPPPVAEIMEAARSIGLPLRPMFPEASLPPRAPEAAPASPELRQIEQEQGRYFVLHATTQQEAQEAADRLKNLSGIETVYIKPAVENPLAPPFSPSPVGTIPDFSPGQGYLEASPGGVGARQAWALPGGRGGGVRIIDIEGGWTLEHVDLRGNTGGLLGGQPFTDPGWTEHGTAVLGVIRGDDNGFGVTGIAPDTNFSVVSHQGLGSAGAIAYAADRLAPGDVMLLEMHRPGPRFGYADRNDQLGYIAVEWWPDDFLAIRRAILRGIIVVEAAGNGAQNLDDPFYDQPHPAFPGNWHNPFRGAADSGAVLVGAGAPPTGQFGPDRSRLDFSNHGSRIDCQGWGVSLRPAMGICTAAPTRCIELLPTPPSLAARPVRLQW